MIYEIIILFGRIESVETQQMMYKTRLKHAYINTY